MECIKKIGFILTITLLSSVTFGQITSGKIVYERKTNLKKKLGGEDMWKRFLEENGNWKIDMFELYFNDTASVFQPVEGDEMEQGMAQWVTTRNTIYQNFQQNENFYILDMWGTKTYLREPMAVREWKVTESKRKIGDHLCRKAIWQKNDSTRIYAWFTVDIIPSVGPESFYGLPGAILGLATEDGGIIYFAKEVVSLTPKTEDLQYSAGKNDVYTMEELKTKLEKQFSGERGKRIVDEMFRWF